MLLVSAPMLGAGLIVGIIISVVQIVTSIHDTALAFVPRIVVTFVVFLIVFPVDDGDDGFLHAHPAVIV